MAKKPKKPSGTEEEAGAAQAEEGEASGKGSGRKKLIIIIAAALVVAGGGGAGAFFYLRGSAAHEHAEAVPVKKTVAFVDIREMTVNLAPEQNQERPRFLKFKVALELKDPKVAAEIHPLLPRVEDMFQVFARELRASDFDGSAGMYRLREELLRRVNVAVYPAKVDAVLFKEIVVQ